MSVTAGVMVVMAIFFSFNLGRMPRQPALTIWILSAALIVIASELLELTARMQSFPGGDGWVSCIFLGA